MIRWSFKLIKQLNNKIKYFTTIFIFKKNKIKKEKIMIILKTKSYQEKKHLITKF